MKNTGSKLFSLLLGSGMMLATTLPAHALSKSDVNHAVTLPPTGQKSTVIAQAAPSPMQGAQKNEVVKKGYMETSFTGV